MAINLIARSLRRTGKAAEDVGSAASDTISTGVRKGTSPLSIAAVGGAGAYSYSRYAETQSEEQRTERYREYQSRLADIEHRYERGEISKAEMEDLKEEAKQAYYASNDSDGSNRGLTATELIAQMGTIQLTATAAVLMAGLYFVARPIAQSISNNDVSLESILG